MYNAPLYVAPGEDGRLDLTAMPAPIWMSVALPFDMTIISKVPDSYHTACFLNREPSDVTLRHHIITRIYQNSPQETQVAYAEKAASRMAGHTQAIYR